MKLRFYFFFLFYTLLFLFYPGDSFFFKIFADHRSLFAEEDKQASIELHPIPQISTSAYPFLTADGVLILDLPSFTPILEKNSHSQFFPASTTKIITALVAVDVFKPDQVITLKRVVNEGQVMGLQVGEQITAEYLLYGLLIHSGNDAAYALADAYGYNAFIALMNQKAASLGMKNSHFVNPAGLDDPQQYSSPFDLALGSRELLKHPALKKIVSIKEITISDVNYQIFHKLSNVNKLLGEIQGIGGLKTGYTENAGENLVSFYKKNGHEFLIVILKSQDRFLDTQTAVKWIDSSVKYTYANVE